jgi:hypothetical protein
MQKVVFQRRSTLLSALGGALLLALTAALPKPALASLVLAMDVDEMTNRADRVVVGEVLSVTSAWEPDHKRIFTNIEVQVAETWKGSLPATGKILVQQPGGRVGDIESRVFGLAQFRPGDRAVLFLAGSERASAVLGLGQGARPLRFDQTSHAWMVSSGNRAAVVKTDRQGRFVAADPEPASSLEALRARVQLLVKP